MLGRVLAPHTQGAMRHGWGFSGCIRWPVPLADRYHVVTVRGAPPILLVASTHDPSTSYVWSHEMRDHIACPCCSRATATVTLFLAEQRTHARRHRPLPHHQTDTPAQHRLSRLSPNPGAPWSASHAKLPRSAL